MKKVYCDRCGKEVEQVHYITLGKVAEEGATSLPKKEFFDICPKCRESFFGWIGGQPAGGEKSYVAKEQPKHAAKPAKKSAKEGKSNAYTIRQIAELSGAPVTTVRRHAEGICSTYGKDKQGRTIRRYHLTDDQLTALLDRIKERKQGQRTKI
jgi:hypothetical protein